MDKFNRKLTDLLTLLGGVFLVGMILLTCANIFLRVVWLPIRGTFELMGYAGAVVTAFALAYTQRQRGHIAVDVLASRFKRRTRRVLDGFNYLCGGLFFVLAAWQVAVKAGILHRSGEISETLRIVYYPFTYAVAFGCAVLALVLLTGFIQVLGPGREGGP